MAFAVTGFKVQNIPYGSSTREEVVGQMRLTITATTADVAIDLSNAAGTFWTAALADATFGVVATAALAALQAAQAVAVELQETKSELLLGRVKAVTAGAGTYSLTVTNHAPVLTFNAGAGAGQVLTMQWLLQNNTELKAADYGA